MKMVKLAVIRMTGLGLGLLVAGLAAVHAQNMRETPLEGMVWTEAGTCTTGKGPCKLNFEIEGEAAKRIYEAMRTPVETDHCTEGTMKTDQASGLHCYKAGDGRHGCYLGYDAAHRKIVQGTFSC